MSQPTRARYLLASIALLAGAIGMAPALQAQIAPAGSIEQRLDRIERLLQSSGLMRMLQDIDTLKQEVRDLRGEIELQSHSVSQIQAHQRELYLDVDRRLQQVETGGASPSVAGAAPVAAGSTVARTPSDASTGSRGTGPAPSVSTPAPAPPAVTGAAPLPPASPRPPAPPAPTSVAAAAPATAQSPTQTVAPMAPADAAREQQAYQDAFNLLKAGRYDQASKAFQTFLRDFPNGQFTDNAQYWLGETYYVTRQFELAMDEFQTLTREHPDSQKQTHALLKIGYIYDELDQPTDARRVLEDLVSRYPQTTAAALARKRLQRLRSE